MSSLLFRLSAVRIALSRKSWVVEIGSTKTPQQRKENELGVFIHKMRRNRHTPFREWRESQRELVLTISVLRNDMFFLFSWNKSHQFRAFQTARALFLCQKLK